MTVAHYKRPVRVKLSRDQLIESLRQAAEAKGSTPISTDADRKLFGLYGKYFYLREFGSWNEAIRAAELPVNEWNHRRRNDGETMEQYVSRRIDEAKTEIEILEGILASYRAKSDYI